MISVGVRTPTRRPAWAKIALERLGVVTIEDCGLDPRNEERLEQQQLTKTAGLHAATPP